MALPALRLPFRSSTVPLSVRSAWTCRRCMETMTAQTAPVINLPPTLSPQQLQSRSKPSPKEAQKAIEYDPTLPANKRSYPLLKEHALLKKPLPHSLPGHYLMHASTSMLPRAERVQQDILDRPKSITGVVVSAGKMDKTVRVRVRRQMWNKRVKKYFERPIHHLVHDPNNSLILGDVILLHRLHKSSTVHHVVAKVLVPFATEVADRPHIPTADQRLADYKEKRFAKLHRRSLRRSAATGNADAIEELRDMGLDPGKGAEPGKNDTADLEVGEGEKYTPTKTAVLGNKGQKLPTGVLPGGKHAIGSINDRAQANATSTKELRRQTRENVEEAKAKAEEMAEQGIVTNARVSSQGPYKRQGSGERGE